MKVALSTRAVTGLVADLLVIPIEGDPRGDARIAALDRALRGQLLAELGRLRFGHGSAKELLFQTRGAVPARSLVVLALPAASDAGGWYQVADAAVRAASAARARTLAIALPASGEVVSTVAEGVALARYTFTRFRSRPEPVAPFGLTLAVSAISPAMRRAVTTSQIFAEAACFARDLANTPAGALTPRALAAAARGLATSQLRVTVHDRRAIKRLRMGALLGVAQGSTEPPVFIEMTYRPQRPARRRVALVGKGITFDSGGLSLKNADSMQSQKRDMAGGAVVLGVMHALARLQLPIEVRGYIPATENMPSGSAIKPGDVLRARNGTTIEVLNTDAEGRLVLADALAYAAEKRPDVMIDFATLTAAVRSALGNRYAAILGTGRDLIEACIAAGRTVDEKLWELPLASEYRRDIDSRVADIKNTGEGNAGTIIGALFLREFVGDVPWAHVDFSSTVMSDGHPCHPKGASGFAVRTTLRYLNALAEASAAQSRRTARSPARRRRTR